ncbi:MAG: hypothetical protein ACI93R_002710 [Flavobacteriales bacterium]|jgi:hypothetical protein
MSKLIFVNYASGPFVKNKKWNNKFIKLFVRPDLLLDLNDRDLKQDSIYLKGKAVFDEPKGGGYWAWKPWAILKAFDSANEGDIVIYQDCGIGLRFKNFIKPTGLINIARRSGCIAGVEIPEYGLNKFWTKAECFDLMGCGNEKYKESPQIEATTSIWVVGDNNRKILKEWLNYCLDVRVICDVAVENNEIPNFIEHRHDQSILTNLVVKYNLFVIKQNVGISNLFKSLSVQEIYIRRSTLLGGIFWKILYLALRLKRGV